MSKTKFLLVVFLASCSTGTGTYEKYVNSDGKEYLVSYEDGVVVSKIQIDKESKVKQGQAFFFYKSGKLKTTAFYEKGHLTGSHIEYDSTGKIKLFICHDSFGDTVFLRAYNPLGGVALQRGEILPNGVETLSGLKENQEVLYTSFLVNAPHTSTEVKNYYTYNDGRDTVYPYKEEVMFDWRHYYYFKIPEKGTYKYNQITLIVDTSKQIGYRQRDTFLVDFTW